MTRALFAFLLLAAPLRAAFDAMGGQLPGARSAGMGGATVAAPNSAEALAGNPASLPEDASLGGAYFGAFSEGRQIQGLGLVAPFKGDLRLGLLYLSQSDQRLIGQAERTVAALASLELDAGFTAGARVKMEQLESSPLGGARQGFGLDLGLRKELFLGMSLALQMDDVAGSWPSEAWADSLPSTARLGLGLRPLKSLDAQVERVWMRAAQLPEGQIESWRAGAEWRVLPALALRGGWRGEFGGEWSAGLGGRLPWIQLGANYALQARQSGGLGHRVSIDLMLPKGRRGGLSVAAMQVLRDPATQAIRQARFRVDIDPGLRPLSWKLEVKDGEGKVLKTLLPLSGTEGGSVSWNGKDESGRRVPLDAGLRTLLSVRTESGMLELASDMDLERETRKAERLERSHLDLAEDGEAPKIELRPVLAEGGSGKLSHVLVRVPQAPQKDAKSWVLEFTDSEDQVIRRMEGEGELPKEMVWDGKDAQGRAVKDALGVQVKVELEQEGGKKTAGGVPLFSQKAYEIAHARALAKPQLQLASLGLPLSMGREPLSWVEEDAESLAREASARAASEESILESQAGPPRSGTTVMLNLYADGESAMSAEQEEKIKPLLRSLRQSPGVTLVISGISRRDEKNHKGLANRRAMELVSRLKDHGARGLNIVLKDPEEYENTQGVRVEVR